MSIESDMRDVVLAALRGSAALDAATNGIYDGTPRHASVPYVVLGESQARDWGTKDRVGREVRVAVSVIDRGERPERVQAIGGLVEEAVAGLVGVPGCEVASVGLLKSGLSRRKDASWVMMFEFRVRALGGVRE